MAEEWLRSNVPVVTSETFDDEVVIVNFDTGKYHSVQGAGVEVWSLLENGATLTEIVSYAQARFAGRADEVAGAIRTFVSRLREERLVVPEGEPLRDAIVPPPSDEQIAFIAPGLTTFSDMQELLWLDPIHDVDETGWPVPHDAGKMPRG